MAGFVDLQICLPHPFSEWQKYGGWHSHPFMEPVGEAQEHEPQSHVVTDDISDVLTAYYHTDEDGSLFSTDSWSLCTAHTRQEDSQIRKTPTTWAQTMKMPAKPWFMCRWIRCICYFISSNKRSLPSCHSGNVSVNACHTCVVVYTVFVTSCLRCRLANQIKPPLFWTDYPIIGWNRPSFSSPSITCLPGSHCADCVRACISNPVSKGEGCV